MKKLVIVSILILAAAAVFATGEQELNDEGVVKLNRVELAKNSYFSELEKIELAGTVVFESPVPELKVGNKQYSLMAPGAMAFSGYISEGERITVTGYIMDEDSMPCGADGRLGRGPCVQDYEALDGNAAVMVETVEIDGTVYELPWVENGMGGRGGRGDFAGPQGRFGGNGRPGMRGNQNGRFGGMRPSF